MLAAVCFHRCKSYFAFYQAVVLIVVCAEITGYGEYVSEL